MHNAEADNKIYTKKKKRGTIRGASVLLSHECFKILLNWFNKFLNFISSYWDDRISANVN